MADSADPRAMLARAVDQLGTVISGVNENQAGAATPCRSWDVTALINHIVFATEGFTLAATGGTPDWSATAPDVGPDWAGAYRAKADTLLDAWGKADLTGTTQFPGVGTVPARFQVDQQILEYATHAWDLAKATGQSVELDPEIGQAAFGWVTQILPAEFRGDEAAGKVFGPEVAVPAAAPIYSRLAGFMGRDPA